jgi:sec-independent protein translocase protein TatA
MVGLGLQELLVVLAIIAVVFGPSRLPQVGEGVGKLITNFRKGLQEAEAEEEPPQDDLPAPKKPAA